MAVIQTFKPERLDALAMFAQADRFRTVFEAPSFEALRDVDIPDGVVGKDEPFIIELDLNQPVARAFDLFGAEFLFRNAMPEGLDLVDIHSAGPSRVVIETVGDPIPFFLIGAFLARHWVFLFLGAIGLSISLGFLIAAVRGKSPASLLGIPSLRELAPWLIGGGVAVVGLVILTRR